MRGSTNKRNEVKKDHTVQEIARNSRRTQSDPILVARCYNLGYKDELMNNTGRDLFINRILNSLRKRIHIHVTQL